MRTHLHGKRVMRIGSWGHPCVVCRDGTVAAGRIPVKAPVTRDGALAPGETVVRTEKEERLVDLCDGHLDELDLYVRVAYGS